MQETLVGSGVWEKPKKTPLNGAVFGWDHTLRTGLRRTLGRVFMLNCFHKAKMGALALAGMVLAAAAPAHADEAALVPEAQAAQSSGNPLAGDAADGQFQQLFASWEAIDSGRLPNSRKAVAVPSRSPLDMIQLTSGYGMRDHPVLKRRARHKGIDLSAPTGTPIYATADGHVERADWFSSYGLYVQIDHGGELETRYAHMSRLAVKDGAFVRKGDIIGYVGSTGRSTGPHLHYEVRVSGEAVNPIPYMVDTAGQRAPEMAMAEGGRGGGEDE